MEHKIIKLKKKFSIRGKIFPIVSYTLLAAWCAILLLALFWAILTSLKGGYEFYKNPVGLPKVWKFENYLVAFRNIGMSINRNGVIRTVKFWEMLWNSALYCLGSPLFAVMSASMASYVACKYKQFKYARLMYMLVLIGMYVPIGASLAANLKLMRALGLYDNMLGMWIFCSGAFGFMFLVYYATFSNLSWTFAEAAFIDGAGHFRVFLTVMMPMTRTVFIALFVNSFIGMWTDYMTPMIFMPTMPTLAYGAWIFQYSVATEVSSVTVKLAGLLIIAVPAFIVFMIFRRKLMGSLTMGGLKG